MSLIRELLSNIRDSFAFVFIHNMASSDNQRTEARSRRFIKRHLIKFLQTAITYTYENLYTIDANSKIKPYIERFRQRLENYCNTLGIILNIDNKLHLNFPRKLEYYVAFSSAVTELKTMLEKLDKGKLTQAHIDLTNESFEDIAVIIDYIDDDINDMPAPISSEGSSDGNSSR